MPQLQSSGVGPSYLLSVMSLPPAFTVRCFISSEGSTIPLSLSSSWNHAASCFSSEQLVFSEAVWWNIIQSVCLSCRWFYAWQCASRSEGVSLRQDCLLPHSSAVRRRQEWPNLSCNCAEWIQFKTQTETFYWTTFQRWTTLFLDLMLVAFPCQTQSFTTKVYQL